jgi:mannosyltransferase OCH1-like enzyme
MSQRIKNCIESWHKHMPDYKFINWNDKNFDWDICEFTKHCRKNNIYAFCSDYVRFWALYNYGGIYLDTDVFVYKSFDELLDMRRIMTREYIYNFANLEAAILGAEKGDNLYGKLIDFYNTTNKFPPNNAVIAPWALLKAIEDNRYKLNEIKDKKDEVKREDIVNVLDCKKYFFNRNLTSDTFATHLFNNQWWNKDFNIIKA